MNHTVSGQQWQNLWFNGTLVGETGINAALCGQWGCPVLLVTGDDAVCREAKELLGDGVTTVAVKTGLSSFSARQLPARRARELIEQGAKNALQDLKAVEPYDPGPSCRDQGGVQGHRRGRPLRPQGWGRAARRAHRRLPRRRLVVSLVTVLFLNRH